MQWVPLFINVSTFKILQIIWPYILDLIRSTNLKLAWLKTISILVYIQGTPS